MNRIRICYVHGLMFHAYCWEEAGKELEAVGIVFDHLPQMQAAGALADGKYDILIAALSVGSTGYEEVLAMSEAIPHRLSLDAEVPSCFTTFSAETKDRYADFVTVPDPENYAGALLQLCRDAGFGVQTRAKKNVQVRGIYHPQSEHRFTSLSDYHAWREKQQKDIARPVGILFYHGQLAEHSVFEIDGLITAFEENGLCPVAVFSPGAEVEEDVPYWYQLFQETEGLGAIINCLAGRLLRNNQNTLLHELNVPIWQVLRSYNQTPEQWFDDPAGLPAMSAVFSQTYPEMFGAVRPTLIAGLSEVSKTPLTMGATRQYRVVPERVRRLVQRVQASFRLRESANGDKRITIVLHNNPCKGVEATVGMAVGLDSFASLVLLLKALKAEGYDIGDVPLDGQKLLDMIMDRKAIAEFRWTTVDEIVRKGGALYMMGEDEYMGWFASLEPKARKRVIQDWGPFPGEGMVFEQDGNQVLVITGLKFGNLQIMNQPKRGCYGARCNGEVCRILHDPELAPPHQWLASYKYIQDTSDAVIHFGTEGALEYLPGKQNGLSGACFSEISIGNLPNFYVYVMDAVGEGMVAKRRGQATLIDHLGPVFSPSQLDEEIQGLDLLLDQYLQAVSAGEEKRTHILKKKLKPRLEAFDAAGGSEDFSQQLDVIRRRINGMKRTLSPESLHLLGNIPAADAQGRLMATMLRRPPRNVPCLEELGEQLAAGSKNTDSYALVADCCAQVIQGKESSIKSLNGYCRDMHERLLATPQETAAILHGLNGGYIAPGPAGALTSGRADLLPTGRNFYGKDTFLLPTLAAWEVGKKLADRLLAKYHEDEGRFPESVAVSIWSSDAFKSDGELLCKILYLLGVEPQWDAQETCSSLSLLSLDTLKVELNGNLVQRPRVDMVIETSSIMRDMVPHFCDLMDRAVVLAAYQDEPEEWNYVRKHTLEQLAALKKETASNLNEKDMHRLATFRVFSASPGAYGHGVGLALDASAWTDDEELTEIHVNQGGYAYGEGGMTVVSKDMFARRLAGIDVAVMKQGSEEYDVLDSGFYAVSQGSQAVAARTLGGKKARLYWTDASDERELCDIREQLIRSAGTRLLNKAWIETMKKHGQQGGMAVSSRINNLYKWGATSREVPKALYDGVVQAYILNADNRAWLMRDNPYAMEEITRRLLEAHARDIWDADDDLLDAVKEAALETEGDMEERIGEVEEEYQGGSVDVLGRNEVEKWQHDWQIES